MKLFAACRRFLRQQQGVALIEMAAVAPFLILLVLGSIELSRYVLIAQKVNRAGFVIADIASQEMPATLEWVTTGCDQALEEGGVNQAIANDAMNQLNRLMMPFHAPDKEMVILSSVTKKGTRLLINWQVSGGGTLTTGVTSDVTGGGAQGACCQNVDANFGGDTAAQLNGTSGVPGAVDGENFIVGEVFYRYQPIVADVLNRIGFNIRPTTMVRRVYMRPRNGDQDYMPPAYPVPTPAKPGLPSECTACCVESHLHCSMGACEADCTILTGDCPAVMESTCGFFNPATCGDVCDLYGACP